MSCIQVTFGSMPHSHRFLNLCSITCNASKQHQAPLHAFLLPVMRPFLKGMHILKTYRKGSTLFDAPTASGKRRAMAGTHWPVHMFTDAVMPTRIPPVAGEQCHPLHKAVVHQPSAVPSVAAAVSNQPLTMLFEARLEQQDALMLLDSGASANFISKKALDIGKLTLKSTEATLELADGSLSPILGTTIVNLRIGAFSTRVSCFVTELSIDFDIVLGNPFLTSYKAVLNCHLDTCTLVQHNKTCTLRPLSYSGADCDSPHCNHTLRIPSAPVAASARRPVEKLLLNASSAGVLCVKVVKVLLLWSTLQWFLTLMFPMALLV